MIVRFAFIKLYVTIRYHYTILYNYIVEQKKITFFSLQNAIVYFIALNEVIRMDVTHQIF